MKRRLLNLLTALSLLLCVASSYLWVRSQRVSLIFGYYPQAAGDGWYGNIYVVSYDGHLTFISLDQTHNDHRPGGRFYAREDPDPSYQDIPTFAGFGFRRPQGRTMKWTEVQVSHWAVVLVTGIAPMFALAKMARRRRGRGAGLCPVCGYDLRATPERCPECGHAAAGAAA